MRPGSITIFHRLMIAVIAVRLTQTVAAWSQSQALLEANPATSWLGSWWFLGGVTLVSYGFYGLIWYRIVARAGNVARWIFAVITVLGLIGMPMNLANASSGLISPFTMLLMIVSALLQLAALVCLFLPDARRWFANKGVMADPLVFE